MVQTLSVMGEYFGVMQIPIRAGRDFSAMDREGEPRVAIVNEEFARQLLPGQNPIGTRIDWARNEAHEWMTIVGVAGDVKHSGLNQPVDPAIYAPFSQNDEAWRKFMTLVIRTRVPAGGLVEDVKKEVWSLDNQIPISSIQSMNDLLAVSERNRAEESKAHQRTGTLDVVRGGPMLKQITSQKLRAEDLPRFWQVRYYDFPVWSEAKRIGKLRYIHRNPVKRGLVERPQDWKWSSFVHYATGMEGIVEIESQWTARRREQMGVALVVEPTLPPRTRGQGGATLVGRLDSRRVGEPRR